MALLIGRTAELALFRTYLATETQTRIVNVTGLAGMGKSTLVEELAATARDSGAHTAIVNARTLTSDPTLLVYPAAVQALTVLTQEMRAHGRELRTLTRRLERYATLHWEVQQNFSIEERPAVATILQVGVAAVRAGSTVLPVAKPLEAILTPELVTKLSQSISKYRREPDRMLLVNPVEQLTALFVQAMNSLTRGERSLVLVFDEFELASHPLDHWLRMLVTGHYGEFTSGLLVVVAGRRPLGQDWIARGNAIDVVQWHLERFSRLETEDYLRSNVPSLVGTQAQELAASLADASRIPLILRLLTAQPHFAETLQAQDQPVSTSLLQNELVERLLDNPTMPAEYRDTALRLSVARSFDVNVLAALGASQDRLALVSWLAANGFINAQAPRYAYYDLLRTVFLEYLTGNDPDLVNDLHQRLAEHYQARLSAARQSGEVQHELPVAVAYHQLSMLPRNHLSVALRLLFEYLPTAYEDCASWSRALEQVVQERPGMDRYEARLLHRLATVLANTYALTTPAPAKSQFEAAEPAVNMLFASSFDDSWPAVSDQDAEIWLTYFESRLKIITGGVEDLAVALQELRRCWAQLKSFDTKDERTTHLLFRLATELADIYARRGDLGSALQFSEIAVRAARKDGSPTREAFSLYKLSNNCKRQGKYNLALRHLNHAITLIERVGSRSAGYYRGRLLLDKAITLTYMNQVRDAMESYEDSRRCFAEMSPSIYGELSHRIGWLKRVSGDLTGALDDHQTAVRTLRHGVALESVTTITGSSYALARALHSMGNVYVEMCRHELALECFDEALVLFQRQGGTRHQAIVRKDQAWSVFQLRSAQAAENDLLRSVADLDFRSESPTRPAVNSATHLAEAWLNLAIVRSCAGKFDEAESAVDAGISALAGDKDNSQLVHRLKLQRALVNAGRGFDSPDVCAKASAFAASHVPVLHQITADVLLVRAAVAASIGAETQRDHWYTAARAEAARWNRFAADALDERWHRIAACIVPTFSLAPMQIGADEMTITTASPPAVATDEMLDVYDENGNLLGQASKPLVHTVGLWHRTFHCWIIRQDTAGEWMIVLQQRGPGTRTYPGYLDISVAGHYQAGEGIEGGLRECAEELGITGSRDQLTLVARRVVNEPGDSDTINREFQDIYQMTAEHGVECYRPGFPEVTAVYECGMSALEDLIHGRTAAVPATGVLATADSTAFETVTTELTIDQFIPAARSYHVALLKLLREITDPSATRDSGTGPVELPDGSIWEVL